MDPAEDLAAELSRRLREDEDTLHKPKGIDLLDRLVIACVQDGLVWSECLKVFRQARIIRTWEPRIKKLARRKQGVASVGGDPALSATPVTQIWHDAGVHSEASAPPGFGFNDRLAGAIYKIVSKTNKDGVTASTNLKVSGSPVVIRRRVFNDDGSISLEVAWKDGDQWTERLYNREHVFDSSKIIGRAAGDGMPVSSANNNVMVEYIAAYEEHNMTLIPPAYSSSTFGWQGSHGNLTKHGFLFGNRQIGGNGRQIEFRGSGPGDVTEGDLYRSVGTFEAWKAALGKLAALPAFKVLLYAALAPPLLPILAAPNMIVEIVGDTSRGKTTAMEVAQSCWRASKTMFDTWDNTVVGFETKAHLHTDVPLFIDDTKTAIEHGKKQQLAKVIYQFVSGKGRGRGARDGGQRASSFWRSLMITSGEVPSSDIAQSEGAAARVLSLWGTPLGDKVSAEAATTAQEVVDHLLNENYGHAGPRVVLWLHENRDKWDDLKKRYNDVGTRVRQEFTSAAASRLAKVIGLLDTASYVASQADCLPWKWTSLLDDPEIYGLLRSALEHATKAADHATQAWRHIISYAESRPSQWIKYGEDPQKEPDPQPAQPQPDLPHTPGGWYPRSDPRSDPRPQIPLPPRAAKEPLTGWLGWVSDDCFMWFPSQLKRALKESQYAEETETILRKWRDREVIESTSNRLGVLLPCAGEGRPRVWVVPIMRRDEMQVDDPPCDPAESDDFIPF